MEKQEKNIPPNKAMLNSSETNSIHDIGIASQIGSYSDAILLKPNQQLFFTSGTPGLSANGDLPKDIRGQAELAWKNIIDLLDSAGMSKGDIVKVTQYLINAEDIKEYSKVRKQFLGDLRPASMLLIIPQLVWPDILLEIEIIAAKAI